mmetsp:Transcript_1415/g.2207  ORF Transcript_1415/g.2207 Transcript_1415/m.2207 type:complete len:163 (+) Transcript_1415:1-489(+)
MASAFSEFVLKQHGLQSVEPIRGQVVIVDRQPYVSHPRSDPNSIQRQSYNLDKLKEKLAQLPGVNVQLVRLETMSFREQVKLIRQTHVLIGNHGAALSHLMFMDSSRSHVIEFSYDFNNFFQYMSEWKGISFEMVSIGAWGIGALDEDKIEKTAELIRRYTV